MSTRRLRDAGLSVDLPASGTGTALRTLAILAVALDVATTAWIVHSPAYIDLNLIVTGLESAGPWAAVAGLLAVDLVLLWVCLGHADWLGTATATFLVFGPGAGGVNNLLLFLTGLSLMEILGGILAVNVLVPAAAVALGVTTAWLVHGPPTIPQEPAETGLRALSGAPPRTMAVAIVAAGAIGVMLYGVVEALF